jgi:prefoldin subunit 5
VGWNKIKRLFVEDTGMSSMGTATAAPAAGADLAAVSAQVDADLAALQLPADKVGELPPQTDPSALKGNIDFQALYDQAGIPNTDEVEQLEKFLSGLDDSLPQASRLAAAKAFLSAIGKSSADVLTDAGRKIEVVRAVDAAKATEVDKSKSELQSHIDQLQAEIETAKREMESINGELESVRAQCVTEETRLQGARIFFGQLGSGK